MDLHQHALAGIRFSTPAAKDDRDSSRLRSAKVVYLAATIVRFGYDLCLVVAWTNDIGGAR